MSKPPQIRARIKFVAPDRGGRNLLVRSGTRSELKINDLFTSCVVRGSADEQIFEFEVEYDVVLDLLFWDRYKGVIHVGMPVQLNEGNRIVGSGKIEAIETRSAN